MGSRTKVAVDRAGPSVRLRPLNPTFPLQLVRQLRSSALSESPVALPIRISVVELAAARDLRSLLLSTTPRLQESQPRPTALTREAQANVMRARSHQLPPTMDLFSSNPMITPS